MLPRHSTALLLFATSLAVPAASQRTMRLLAPPIVGQAASFALRHPAAAAGNLFVMLWSPPFASAVPVALPGWTVQGLARIDTQLCIVAARGVLDASGQTQPYTVSVPAASALVGYGWDLQGADLDVSTLTWTFADDELQLVVADTPLEEMVPIAPGVFLMGSDQGLPEEQAVHQVTLTRPVWMSRYEVTQWQFESMTSGTPSLAVGQDRPVEMVTWYDAMAFCVAVNALETAFHRLPSGYVYRLPTEAEWEYCCRAGTTTEWNVGASLACADANAQACVGATTVIGSYPPNAWGLHDMHGNVNEWCLDARAITAGYPASAEVDPYVSIGPIRVVRGGAAPSPALYTRSAARAGYDPSSRGDYGGFRVVLAPILP
jgi:hypothetical protein